MKNLKAKEEELTVLFGKNLVNGDGWVFNMLLQNIDELNAYKATPVFNFVGSKFALSKSVNEFFSIISSRISTYFTPIEA